jgi:hypothetical protein
MTRSKTLGFAIACLASQAFAQSAAAEEHECCVTLTPYYWAVGIDGTIEDNRGPTTNQFDFSNDFGDISDNLEFNGSLLLEFNKGHWANYAQIDRLEVNNNDIDRIVINGVTVAPDLQTETTLASAATGYRWQKSERTSIDFLIGVRYAKVDAQVDTRFGSADGDADLVDGILMMRPRFYLGNGWAFNPTWAIGGGDSDLTYELAPEFVWMNECCGFEVRIGYRTVHYEYEEDNIELDFDYSGPMVGVGFKF